MNFSVTIIDDDIISDTVKQFAVSLNSTQDRVLFGSDNHTAIVNIIDNDSKKYSIRWMEEQFWRPLNKINDEGLDLHV